MGIDWSIPGAGNIVWNVKNAPCSLDGISCVDPLFIDDFVDCPGVHPLEYDVHVQAGSPAIGLWNPSFGSDRDFNWYARSVTTGAYEFGSIPTAVEPLQVGAAMLAIRAPRPNPSRAAVLVEFELSSAGSVEVAVYDLAGRRVRGLMRGVLEAGRHTVIWNGSDGRGRAVGPGIYFVRLLGRDGVAVGRVVRAQ